MDILVIDRESLTNQLITSKLGAKGHQVMVEPNKNAAFALLGAKPFDCVMVDPAPLSEARPVIIGVWKSLKAAAKPYLILLSKSATTEDAILAGANDVLIKPLSSQELDEKTGNAARLIAVARMLAREDNVHSTGGMIGKANSVSNRNHVESLIAKPSTLVRPDSQNTMAGKKRSPRATRSSGMSWNQPFSRLIRVCMSKSPH